MLLLYRQSSSILCLQILNDVRKFLLIAKKKGKCMYWKIDALMPIKLFKWIDLNGLNMMAELTD